MISSQSPRPALQDKELTFIEHFSLLISDVGLPRATGKVLGLLLICEPHYQAADVIQQQLKLSTGSVSSALLMLQRLGFVHKVTRPEERRYYYELDPDCWRKIVEARKHQIRQGAILAQEGLTLNKDNSRLKGMKQLYEQAEKLLQGLELT